MRARSFLAATAAVMTLGIALPAPAYAGDLNCEPWDSVCHDLQQAKQDQADVGRRLEETQKLIKDTQRQVVQLLAIVNDLNARIERQRAAIAETQRQIDETDRQIRFTEAEMARREAHITVRDQYLNQRVRSMDKHGTINYFELIVTSRNFSQLIDRVVIMQEIVRGDRQLLDQLRQEREQVQKLDMTLQGKRAEQAQLMKQQQDQKAQLDATLSVRKKALDFYKQLEAQYEEQRRQMEAERARLDAVVLVLQQQYDAAARAVGGGNGQFVWPETSRYITQGFGPSPYPFEPPYGGYAHFHTGIDIGGPYGADIFAADSGVVGVASLGYNGGYGNTVVIIHGNGYSTRYAHMTGFASGISQGAVVRRGQPIGYEGSTGNSTGPHLHFEIKRDADYLNPCSFLGC